MTEKKIEKKFGWLSMAANFILAGVFVFLGIIFITKPARAINQQITFQGKLTNTSGYNVANGTYYVKLTIYDAASGGSCQYSATSSCASVTSTPVTITNGIFSVNLGDTSASLAALPATLFNAPALYLGITVCSGPGTGCDSEMTPRKRLTSVPYAFNSDYLGGVTTSTAGGNGSYIPATDSSGNLRISNSVYIATSTSGQFGMGTSTVPSGVKTYVESTTATNKLLVIRGSATQSGKFTEWQDSSARTLGSFTTTTSGGLPYFQLDLSGDDSTRGGLLTIDNGAYLVQSQLYLGDGTASGTYGFSNIILNQQSGYNQGTFYVSDGVSSVSASGTLTAFQGVSIGTKITGNALLYIKSTSTTAIPFQINNTDGYLITSIASSSVPYFWTPTNQQLNSTSSVGLILGDTSGLAGYVQLKGNSAYPNGGALIITNTSNNVTGQFGGGQLTLSSAAFATTTLSSAKLMLNQKDGFNEGKFYVDASGNVSASGSVTSTGNMKAARMLVENGSWSAPAFSFYSDQDSGFYQDTLNEIKLALNAADSYKFTATALSVPTTITSLNDTGVVIKGNFENTATAVSLIVDTPMVWTANGAKLASFRNFSAEKSYIDLSGAYWVGNGAATSSLAATYLSVSSSTTNRAGLFYVDSSGNTSASGTLTVFSGSTFGGALNPTTDNLYDIGSSSTQWRYGNFQGGLLVADGTNTSTLSNTSLIVAQGLSDALGKFYVDSSGNTNVSGTLKTYGQLTVYGNALLDQSNKLYLYNTSSYLDYTGFNLTITAGFTISNSGSTGGLIFKTGSGTAVQAMTILPNNSVGIGNITPYTGTFDVNNKFTVTTSSGNVSASGSLTVFGNSTLGDSDAAGGDTARVYGALAMGMAPTGAAQLAIQASSTTAIPFLIKSSDSNNMMTVATSSLTALFNGTDYNYGVIKTLTLGQTGATLSSGIDIKNGGTFVIRNIQSGESIMAQFGLIGFDTDYYGGMVVSKSGATTTTLDYQSFILGQTNSFNKGKFYVDSSGNTSASGTLTAFGNSTLGDSDAAGGDTARVYGALALGMAPTGAAQLTVQATSTGNQVVQKWVDKNSKVMGSMSSGTVSILASGVVYSDISNLVNFTIGDAAGLGGYLNLQTSAVASNIPGFGGYAKIGGLNILDSSGAQRVGLGYVAALGGSLTLGGTSATSTLDTTSIMLNQSSGSNKGDFYVNAGNVSASGTLSVFNEIYSSGNVGMTLGIVAATRNKGLFNVDGNGNVSASGSLAAGTGLTRTGTSVLIFGDNNSNAGAQSFVGGQRSTTTATAGWSMAMGQDAMATGSASFALGQNVQAANDNSFAIGRGVFGGAALKNDIAQSLMIGFDSANPTMIVKNGGVGIATTTLINGGTYKLLVDAGSAAGAGIGVLGYIKATGVITQSTTLDLAEKYPIDPACEARDDCPEAGDVVVAKDSEGGAQTFYIHKAVGSNQEKVIGIVSTQPGFVLGGGLADSQSRNLTLAGRVPVKVSAENGAIKIGDKLTVSSAVSGAAMKYTGNGTIIGMALENYSSLALGKIVAYVSLSWDRTTNLNTQNNSSGQLVQQDLNLGGYSILNIKSIVGKDNKWEIDENGWLINTLATTQGEKKVYGVASESAELSLSGSGQLVNGEARVELATSTREMISAVAPIKVSVTLTAEARGVYVSEKGAWGFVVKELNGGSSGATFDWLVIARRKTQEEIDRDITKATGAATDSANTSASDTNSSSSLLVGGTEGGVGQSSSTAVSSEEVGN